jgi:hypothetical protein
MNPLLRALLLRNRFCAPVGPDGELPGGAAAEDDAAGGDDGSSEGGNPGADEAGDGQADAGADDGEGEGGTPAATAEADDDLVITLEGEDLVDEEDPPPPGLDQKASAKFAEMRANNKRLQRENRELKAQQEAAAARAVQQPAAVEPLGDEPTLEDEDVDYDPVKFAEKFKAWTARKTEHDARQREAEQAQRKQQEAWQQRLDAYKAEAAKLKRPDFEDAEANVKTAFSTVQQGLLLKHPKAAALVYVLGKNPARAKTLAAIADPVDFAYAAADLAGHVKVERKSPPPPTDTPVRGRTTGAALASQTLEGLREQARRTGDYSAYYTAKRAAESRREKATA